MCLTMKSFMYQQKSLSVFKSCVINYEEFYVRIDLKIMRPWKWLKKKDRKRKLSLIFYLCFAYILFILVFFFTFMFSYCLIIYYDKLNVFITKTNPVHKYKEILKFIYFSLNLNFIKIMLLFKAWIKTCLFLSLESQKFPINMVISFFLI